MSTLQTVLLVDGQPSARRRLAAALAARGLRVLEAADLAQALLLATREQPAVAVVELALRDGTGVELVERVRAVPGLAALRAVAVSSSLARLDAARASGMGFDAYFFKPVEPARLAQAIDAALARAGYGAAASPHDNNAQELRTPRRRVLVVDDDPIQRKLLEIGLRQLGLDVDSADDGLIALGRAQRQPPDALVSDLLMPGLDGFRLCLALRGDVRTARVPVVLIASTVPEELDLRLAQTVGANVLLSRAVEASDVASAILAAIEEGAVAAAPSPHELLTETHLFRAVRQLERQVGLLGRTERSLRESESRYRLVLEATNHGVWDWDLASDELYWNPRLLALVGIPRTEFGATYEAFVQQVHPEDRAAFSAATARHLETDEPFDVAFRLMHASGTWRHVESRGKAARDASGRPVRMAGLVADVTERVQHEQERARLLAQTQEAVRARDEFLSIASHELRTPLTSLQLHVQSMLATARGREGLAALDPRKAVARLETVERQTRRLVALIGEMLDVSRVVNGRLEIDRAPTDLAAVTRDAIARFADEPLPGASTVTLRAPEAVVTGEWDRQRLDQVVTNLVANARKYGEGRPVDVEVRLDGEVALLVVRDRGIGIEPAKVAQIFERFERAVSARNYGGLGLGLYITRQIVEAHGGTIRVESRLGGGSTFTVALPRTTADASGQRSKSDARSSDS